MAKARKEGLESEVDLGQKVTGSKLGTSKNFHCRITLKNLASLV